MAVPLEFDPSPNYSHLPRREESNILPFRSPNIPLPYTNKSQTIRERIEQTRDIILDNFSLTPDTKIAAAQFYRSIDPSSSNIQTLAKLEAIGDPRIPRLQISLDRACHTQEAKRFSTGALLTLADGLEMTGTEYPPLDRNIARELLPTAHLLEDQPQANNRKYELPGFFWLQSRFYPVYGIIGSRVASTALVEACCLTIICQEELAKLEMR